MLPSETKVLLKLLADAALGAKSTAEIYELITKLISEDEVLEPHHIAEEKKEESIPVTHNTAEEGNGEEVLWHDFPEERLLFYFDRIRITPVIRHSERSEKPSARKAKG